ncbi:MAG: (2Fe-2S)-binding protein [Acetobacteraceae bacterium]|nr:(2Fe-2S)-binding protein [Acetobacteraceae bacterium]
MLKRPEPGPLILYFEDQAIHAQEGDSIACALLANGILTTRSSTVSGASRGPFCMMGACFECLAEVDGQTGVQTCMAPVREGMRIRRQLGARSLR